MKYPEVGMAADMPSSLQLWLGQQLDSRGIDASIYARYVLSILQQEEDLELDQPKKGLSPASSFSAVSVGPEKTKTKAKKVEKKKTGESPIDEVRKMAAINCLLSVTDEASGIESLVEELYLKLKELRAGEAERNSPKKILHEIQLQSTQESTQSPEDPAEKYYAAFPALFDKCDELKPKAHKTPEDKVWARIASKSLGEDTSGDSSGSPDPYTETEREHNNNIYGRRKGIKSPPKEEKERKNFESKHKGVRLSTKFNLSPRDRHRDSDYSSSDSGGKKNKKRSPNSRVSPNNRYYCKGKNVNSIKGKALFKNLDDEFPPKKSAFLSRRSFPEFHPPSFIVPKTKVTPKKSPMKYGTIEDAGQGSKHERCRSEEKACSVTAFKNLYRCFSESIGNEEDTEDGSVKRHDLLEEELKYLMASVEDLVWYTKPLDDIIMPSPIPKQRLYERNAENETGISVLFNEEEGESFKEDFPENLCESYCNSPMEEFEVPAVQQIQNDHDNINYKDCQAESTPSMQPNELVFKEDYFEAVSRESSCANLQDVLGFGFNYVPPNTPVHLQDMHGDALGLSSLILLAEQMKNLSQESDPEFDLLSKFVSQEDASEGLSQEDIYKYLSQEESCKEMYEEQVYVYHEDDESEVILSVSPGEILPYSCSPSNQGLTDGEDFVSLFALLDTVKESKCEGIPTPLSACGSTDDDGKDLRISSPLVIKDLTCTDISEEDEYDAASDVDEVLNNSGTNEDILYGEHADIPDIVKDDEADSDTNEGESFDISVFAASLGHNDVLKHLDLDSSGDSGNVSFTGLKHGDIVESEIDQNDIEAAQYSKTDCDIIAKSHLIWWDISGKPSIWSCVGDVGNAVWDGSNMSKLWNKSENAFKGGRLATRPSPLREFFSPCFHYNQEPKIWDINMQMLDFSAPFETSSQFSPTSIFGRQVNVTFSSSLQMTFIEGGLYGNEWDRLLEGKNEQVPELAEVFENQGSTWLLNPPQLMQRSRSDEFYPCIEVGQTMSSIPKVPSEHSAFTDVARNDYSIFQNGPIHHVHSEPILSPDRSMYGRGYAEAHYRMIEVKHLYKSDTSILRQLGLASGTDAEETDQSIEYSPDRHFVPIRTPQGSFDHASPAISDTVTVIPEDPLTDKGSLEGSWNGSFKSASRSSSYQLYKEKEPAEEEDNLYFIPRFKVQKQYEKCAQTGDSPLLEVDEDHERTLTERLLTDMNHVLDFGDSDGETEEQLTIKDLNDSILLQDCSAGNSDYESMGHDTSGDEYQSTGIASLWEEQPAETKGTPTQDPSLSTSNALYKSIWSRGLESDIPSVPTELGTTATNTQEHMEDLLLEAYAAAIDNFEDYLFQDWSTGDHPQNHIQDYPDLMPSHYPKPLPPRWSSHEEGSSGHELEPEWITEIGDEAFIESDQDMIFLMDPQAPPKHPPPMPEDPGLYSSELEEQWLNDQSTFQVQVPLRKPKCKLGKKKVQLQSAGSGKKPCSFFLEGSCRRTDCKFAHNMSRITCKFWEEGECFKGVTCPFLHGYPKLKISPSLKKVQKELKEEFKLEKDDFPELSKSQDDSSDLSTSSGSDKRRKSSTGFTDKPATSQHISTTDRKKKDKSSKSKARSLPIDIKFKTSL